MNATQRLIEAAEDLMYLIDDGVPVGNDTTDFKNLERAIAAAKEEQAKVEPVAWMTEGNEPDIMWASHKAYQSRNAGETRDYLNGKYTIPIYTHPAPAKGSGLTVEGVMRAFDSCADKDTHNDPNALRFSTFKPAFRKALEDLAAPPDNA